MADGFIVRKGGVTVDLTAAPSLTLVSKTDSQIVFTITNNDTETVDIFWEVNDTTPDANTLSLAGGATSSNQTASGLTQNTQFVIHAFANAAAKAGSQTVTLTVTTNALNFTAATGGTTAEYDDGGKRFRSHTFTSNGNFVVSTVGDNIDDRNKVDYLIIAGGGGSCEFSGGGGAGGYRTTNGTSGANSSAESKVAITATTFGITVGSGGPGKSNLNTADSGGNSSAFNITSLGGGGSGSSSGDQFARIGGSGGGIGFRSGTGGSGTANQGFAGGNSATTLSDDGGSGGGGGAGSAGSNASTSVAGNGGNGLANLLRTGLNESRGGGGGGARDGRAHSTNLLGTVSAGGGLAASLVSSTTNQNGVANTGGGAGGGAPGGIGRNGGSGIVVIRYEIAPSV